MLISIQSFELANISSESDLFHSILLFPPPIYIVYCSLTDPEGCPQLTTRGPPPCCHCGDLGAASRLEATVRKT